MKWLIRKLTQQKIEQKIINLKFTIKKLKKNLPLLIFGIGSSVTIFFAAIGIGVLAGSLVVENLSGGVSAPLGAIALFGWIALGGSLITGLTSGTTSLNIFVGLSTADLIITLSGIKSLEKIEKQNPETLSKEQVALIDQFKKITHEPIINGIFKGLKLRKESKLIAEKIINQNPKYYIKISSNKNKAKKIIQNYLTKKWLSHNLKLSIKKYRSKIKAQKNIRNKYSIWKKPVEYHFHNTKLISLRLNPSFTIMKIKSKEQSRAIKKMNRKYGFDTNLKASIKKFIQKANAITAEFKKTI